MNLTILYILLIIFIAILVRSTFGFGESLIAVPLLIFFIPIEIAVPGIPIGLYLLLYGNEALIKSILGAIIILYSIYSLFSNRTIRLRGDNKLGLFICGFL